VVGRLVARSGDLLGATQLLEALDRGVGTLMPLEDPSDLAMMSFTPAISRIARAAPPR